MVNPGGPATKPRSAGLSGVEVPTPVFEVSTFRRSGEIERYYGPKQFRRFSPTLRNGSLFPDDPCVANQR